MRVRRSLTVLSVVGVVDGLVQFGVGVLAWNKFVSYLVALDPQGETYRAYDQLSLPDWPITLVIIGLLAGEVGIAFRASAKRQQDGGGVI